MRLNRSKLEEELKAAAGLTSDDTILLQAYITEDELNKRKAEMKKLRERIEERFGSNPMRFYDMPIDEERKTELKEIVTNKRRLTSQVELQKRYGSGNLQAIHDEFGGRFAEFMKRFPHSEKSRIESLQKRKEIQVMLEYLAQRPEDHEGTAKVKDLILWSQLCE